MKNGTFDKVVSWFVVTEDDEAEEPEGASPPKPAPPVKPAPPPVVTPGAAFDARAFAQVYARAGLAEDARERLGRVMDLVASLPAEATLEVKRAIVSASLQAFGVPVAQVVSACDAATAALDAHGAEGRAGTDQVLAEAQARIDRLAAEIAEVRRLMEVQLRAQDDLVRACAGERERVRATRDFFAAPAADAAPREPSQDAGRIASVVRLR